MQLTTAKNAAVALFVVGGGPATSSKQGHGALDPHRRCEGKSPRQQQQIQLATASSSSRELMCRTIWRCNEEIECLTCEDAGNVFVTGSKHGHIQVYDCKLRHPLYKWHVVDPPPHRGGRQIGGAESRYPHRVQALALSPDGTTLLSLCASEAAIVEWTFSEDTFASAADLTSNDSSDDGGGGFDAEQRAMPAPPVVFSYPLIVPASGDEEGEEVNLRYKIQFHPSGQQFLVVAATASALRSVHLYQVCVVAAVCVRRCGCEIDGMRRILAVVPVCCVQRGEKQAREVVLPIREKQAAFDWASESPLCSSTCENGDVALWQLNEPTPQ